MAKVCQVLQDARQVPNPTTLYLVFTDGFPEQSNFCAWHDGGRCPDGRKIRVAYMPNLAGGLFGSNFFGTEELTVDDNGVTNVG